MDRSLRQSQASSSWAVIIDKGSKPEILSRIAQTTAALKRLKPVWNDRSISLSSKIILMRSLIISIFLYACESWALTAELQRRIQAVEMRCCRKVLRISYKDHVTKKAVRAKIQLAIGQHEDLLTIAKRRKLQWYGHVSRSSGLAKTILQGTVKWGRRQGWQRKRWEDNIREWTGLEFAKSQRAVGNWEKWRKLVVKSSVVPQRPSRLRDSSWWWWWWWYRGLTVDWPWTVQACVIRVGLLTALTPPPPNLDIKTAAQFKSKILNYQVVLRSPSVCDVAKTVLSQLIGRLLRNRKLWMMDGCLYVSTKFSLICRTEYVFRRVGPVIKLSESA